MGDDQLQTNCRLESSENEVKTSTQVGMGHYAPEKTIMYDKSPVPEIPALKMGPRYKPGTIYTPHDGYKTTYDETYKVMISDDNDRRRKPTMQHREFSNLGKQSKPLQFGMSEYNEEYPVKQLPLPSKGVSIAQTTTCPMITTGRDERDPLPLTENYHKYLDIYLSTTRLAHRTFTLQEQRTIAMKDAITSQETMEIPKGRGFGCKFPSIAGQDLDNRDKNMTDKVMFHNEAKLRFIPQGMPRVPNFGSESETKAAFTKPEGYAVRHIFDRFNEYPQTIGAPTAKQNLSPPGMYTTETHAINNHTSPQTVV